MDPETFRLSLHLPAQGAAETEAILIEWNVAEGDCFEKHDVLAQVDSAKSVFDFQAPCRGRVIRRFCLDGETVQFTDPVIEIETDDAAMKDWSAPTAIVPEPIAAHLPDDGRPDAGGEVVLLGVGAYLPERVVSNEELVKDSPEITAQYVYEVTGIRQRHWAAPGEKPSDMAYAASLEAIRHSGIATKDIDAVIVATTTPDVAMPSTACILQDRLSLRPFPAFDLNAACSGWLYAVSLARGMILSGMANNVLTVGVDLQSQLLDPRDHSAYFIFGDAAGAAIISAGHSGHRIRQAILGADTRGLNLARRHNPGYCIANGDPGMDPWIRLDGPAMFRAATESFTGLIREAIAKTGWTAEETRWIIPHQANGRILRAAAKRSGISLDRFFLNIARVGNTSSASIPLALSEMAPDLHSGDKLILCSVGAGITTAAVSVEW
jgi:3-oxoacyl-[acyl-carrier-protein] synthase III